MHRGNEHESKCLLILTHSVPLICPCTMQEMLITLHFELCYTLAHNTHICILCYHYFCLFIHAGSPIVTSLTYDNQSRTLTCTSTCGPATTVTWRRDRVVITLNDTYQQTKRLLDAETGTYQTVLTINSSVGWTDIMGTYNCTVKNERGESSETVIVPGETCSLGA